MTIEQQRKILEAAAKACGITLEREISGKKPHRLIEHESGEGHISVRWNPLTNPADTAKMCAELLIDTLWTDDCVVCGDDSRTYEAEVPLDNSRLKAWMYAATMVAAKVGGMK